MPFKMIANRHVYRGDEKKEYKKGESFTVQTETEKNRLLRNGRAKLDETPTSRPAAQILRTKVLTPEPPPAEPTRPTPAPVEPEHHAEGDIRPGRYARRDLRSEH